MTSDDDLNETTKNLIEALKNYNPPETPKFEYKAVYDPSTMLVTEIALGETDKPYIVITKEEYQLSFIQKFKVEDGKLVVIKKPPPHVLQLVPGSTWHTTEGNMLVIGNHDGWDARKNS